MTVVKKKKLAVSTKSVDDRGLEKVLRPAAEGRRDCSPGVFSKKAPETLWRGRNGSGIIRRGEGGKISPSPGHQMGAREITFVFKKAPEKKTNQRVLFGGSGGERRLLNNAVTKTERRFLAARGRETPCCCIRCDSRDKGEKGG